MALEQQQRIWKAMAMQRGLGCGVSSVLFAGRCTSGLGRWSVVFDGGRTSGRGRGVWIVLMAERCTSGRGRGVRIVLIAASALGRSVLIDGGHQRPRPWGTDRFKVS